MDVTDHHAVDQRGKMTKHRQFVGLHGRAVAFDDREGMVRIFHRRRIAGKMFAATEDAAAAQGAVELSGQGDDLVRGFAVTTSPQRVVRLVVEGNVQHRAEVEIEAEESQEFRGQFTVTTDQLRVPAVAQLLRVGRFLADEPQA